MLKVALQVSLTLMANNFEAKMSAFRCQVKLCKIRTVFKSDLSFMARTVFLA
jgi:hypothetical protein